jgi:hypothetical protein
VGFAYMPVFCDSSGAYEITSRIKKMSIVPKETIEVIAQSIGINNLSPDVALALAPDVEYRMREIMQVDFQVFMQYI